MTVQLSLRGSDWVCERPPAASRLSPFARGEIVTIPLAKGGQPRSGRGSLTHPVTSSQTCARDYIMPPRRASTTGKMSPMPIIQADRISKCFRIYRHPSDHLKELLSFGRRRFHEPFWAVKDIRSEERRVGKGGTSG